MVSGCRAPAVSHARGGFSTGPPNIVLIFCDDLGYADIGPYGSKIPTPHLDRMARDGLKFTDFYVAQPVCSASRTALLTGCYPNRVGILGALGPRSVTGIHSNEITLAEILKGQGYATAAFGKWHLGDAPEFLPTRHGFDEYFGLPYSNDMWPRNPTGGRSYPPLPLFEGERVIETMPDQTQLTRRYTERAVRFIRQHQGRPFFLYVPHSMPHVPIHAGRRFQGHSGQGLYADVIQELDWSVGQIMQTLRETGIERRTLLIFSSDNGPWLLYGDHAGSAGPLREGKATTFEGGLRVPCLMRWPGKIGPGAVCRDWASTMDLLPTLAWLAGSNAPSDRIIDGKNIWPLITGKGGPRSAGDPFFFYWGKELQAVRSGNWKLHFAHTFTTPAPAGASGERGQLVTREIGLSLFDLAADPGERTNVAQAHPQAVAQLERLAEQARADLGDSLQKREGRNLRPAGRIVSQ